jgi:hypothetical protein
MLSRRRASVKEELVAAVAGRIADDAPQFLFGGGIYGRMVPVDL